MEKSRLKKSFQFDRSGNYRIRVLGELDGSWSEKLSGMNITTRIQREGPPVSILVGVLADQASLSGVLNTLYELHLALLSVEYLEEG
ncbi:MAG: hypothetical protein JJV98_17025 [Desulfosarcina sp.]|nr:hypothetical protein [Desulfobacterales bacterium]